MPFQFQYRSSEVGVLWMTAQSTSEILAVTPKKYQRAILVLILLIARGADLLQANEILATLTCRDVRSLLGRYLSIRMENVHGASILMVT